MSAIVRITRRDFLRQTGVGAGAVVFGFCLPSVKASELIRNLTDGFPIAPWLAIKLNGDVVIITHRSEMGQGIRSSLAAVLADELEADWNRVTLRQADADVHKYAIESPYSVSGAGAMYLVEGEAAQLTDSSRSMGMFFQQMRLFGAGLRLVIVRAAAKTFGVIPAECYAEQHKVIHRPSGRSIDYRRLLLRAKEDTLPTYDEIVAALKKPEQWRYIGKGKEPMPFYDALDIVRGRTVYGADVNLPGMLTAMIERCPVANGALVSFEPGPAFAVKGVRAVIPIFPPGVRGGGVGRGYLPHAGVAVVATNTWAALRGREALRPTIKWDVGPHGAYDSAFYRKALEASTAQPGVRVRNKGNVDDAFMQATNIVEAQYYVPHLAPAPMEPPVAVAIFRKGRMEVWAPTQSPDVTQQAVGQVALGLTDEQMNHEEFIEKAQQAATVHVTMLGGGFGRKLFPDFVIEAAILARQKPGVPIRVQWTRDDDLKFSYYNAASSQYLKGALDADGHTTALLQRSAFPSSFGTFFLNFSTPGMSAADITASERARAEFYDGHVYPYASNFERGEGLEDMPYDVPNIRLENGPAESHIRVGCVRSAANIFHAFGICSFADELAVATRNDSRDYLLQLIGKRRILPLKAEGVMRPDNNGFPLEIVSVALPGRVVPILPGYPPDTGRLRAVVERVAKDSGWDEKKGKLPKGRGLGIAAHRSHLSYVAIVADVSLDDRNGLTINEIYGAIDCGLAVNRDRVFAQMEGGIIFGLNLALFGQITVKNGAVMQNDFDDYPVLRIEGTPKIFISIVDSTDPPTGVGEPSVPPVAPALANAIVAAGGPRIRELPLKRAVQLHQVAVPTS